jgi:hypothetical protein
MDLPDAPSSSGFGFASSPPRQPATADASSWSLPAQPPGCQVCGSVPAKDITLHQSIGMVFLRKTKTFRAHVCRDCGIAFFRRIQSATLLTGWWGILSFFLNLGTIWSNYCERRGLQELGDPRPPASRTAQISRSTPLSVGRPTLLRPQALGVVGVAIAVALLFGLYSSDSKQGVSSVRVGACAAVDGTHLSEVDCSDPGAAERIVAILPAGSQEIDCPPTANAVSHSDRYGLVCWGPI